MIFSTRLTTKTYELGKKKWSDWCDIQTKQIIKNNKSRKKSGRSTSSQLLISLPEIISWGKPLPRDRQRSLKSYTSSVNLAVDIPEKAPIICRLVNRKLGHIMSTIGFSLWKYIVRVVKINWSFLLNQQERVILKIKFKKINMMTFICNVLVSVCEQEW